MPFTESVIDTVIGVTQHSGPVLRVRPTWQLLSILFIFTCSGTGNAFSKCRAVGTLCQFIITFFKVRSNNRRNVVTNNVF